MIVGKRVLSSVGSQIVPTLFKNVRIVVFLLFCLFVVCGCTREEENQPAAPIPIQQLETFTTQHTEEGVLKWTLVGESSEMRENKARGNKIVIQNPKVQIYEDGKVSITLTSLTGELYSSGTRKNNVFLYGNVVGVNESGTLHTEKLEWQNKEGKLYAPTEVKIMRGDSTWYGDQMTAYPNLESLKMSNNRFRLYPKDEEINEN